MGKKAAVAVISTLAALTVVGGGVAAAVILTQNNNNNKPVDASEPAPILNGISQLQLQKLWHAVNGVILKNEITVATNMDDANWNEKKDLILDVKIGNHTLRDYVLVDEEGNAEIEQDLANITLSLNPEMFAEGSLETWKGLYEGYVSLDGTNYTITLNNLYLSNPDTYFNWQLGSISTTPNTITGLSKLGANEPNILLSPRATAITANAFANNTKMKNLVMPDTITTLGTGSFTRCTSLQYVKLSKAVKEIPNECFSWDNNITKFDMFEGLTKIGFNGLYSIGVRDLTLPRSVDTLDGGALGINDTAVNRPTTITTWASDWINGFTLFKQTNVTINLMATDLKQCFKINFMSGITGGPEFTIAKIVVKTEAVQNKLTTAGVPANKIQLKK